MKTEITLAICMHNAEKYIEETLACIKAQTMQDFHLLLVDDCSTDRTVEYVERFFQQKQRQYELVKLTQNQGIAYGRNFALHHASENCQQHNDFFQFALAVFSILRHLNQIFLGFLNHLSRFNIFPGNKFIERYSEDFTQRHINRNIRQPDAPRRTGS